MAPPVMCPPLVCECAAHDEFYQACPCVILPVTSAGGGLGVWGEPGNEATWWFVVAFSTGARSGSVAHLLQLKTQPQTTR